MLLRVLSIVFLILYLDETQIFNFMVLQFLNFSFHSHADSG